MGLFEVYLGLFDVYFRPVSHRSDSVLRLASVTSPLTLLSAAEDRSGEKSGENQGNIQGKIRERAGKDQGKTRENQTIKRDATSGKSEAKVRQQCRQAKQQ